MQADSKCCTVIKIILTNGATSATTERSFSMLRRKYDNKDILDNLSLIDVANEFDGLQPDRKNAFGNFTVKDL